MESILVVDDEKLNLKTLSALLKQNYVVILAKNGEQALDKAQKFQPDLILLDILMPKMDGFEVLRRLKELPSTLDIPVIILTGTTASDKEELGLNLGACDYVHKPFNSSILQARIRTHISFQKQKSNLNKLTEQLKKANDAKSRFVANISHEIRTPLTSVLGFSELLKSGGMSVSEMRDMVDHIDRNGRHLLGLINDILDFSKIEANELELVPERIDLFELLKDIQTLVLGMQKKEDVEFKLECVFPLPKWIWVDAMRIRQILVNLLSNAFKFTDKGSVRLKLAFNQTDHVLNFDVIDTGVGIDDGCKDKLFKPFVQADLSVQHKFGGTGLGLSISNYLAQKMNGTLSLQSELQKGSVFSFSMRLTDHQAHEMALTWPQSAAEIPVGRINQQFCGDILIAEDNSSIRKLIEVMLTKVGLSVTSVENGELVIEALIDKSFDVVMMDVQMPVMTGIEAVSMIRKLGYQDLPVIALSAHVVKEEIDKFYTAGFDNFVAKPIDFVNLLAVLAEYLGDRQQVNNQSDNFNMVLDPQAQQQLTNDFVDGLPAIVDALQGVCKSQNRLELSTITHNLKGSASTFHFNEIGQLAGKIEQSAIHDASWSSMAADVHKLIELIIVVKRLKG